MKWHDFLSSVLPLLTMAPYYRNEPFGSIIDNELYPAYQSRQYALEQGKDKNVYAFVSWAIITPDILDDIKKTFRPLKVDDWQSGKGQDNAIVFFNDFVAPFGNCKTMTDYLDKEFFANTDIDAYSRHTKWDDDGHCTHQHIARWRRKL